jgi:Ca2+-transporting ATPase
MDVYSKSVADLEKHFKTSVSAGLSSEEARELLARYGFNVLPKKAPPTVARLLLAQLLNPLMFVLLFAALGSIFIGDVNDALVIMIAVVINVIVGFIQEWRAGRAAEALRTYETVHCFVLRDGEKIQLDGAQLVPGDIVFLEEGVRVPADVRLAQVHDLKIEEALLTGESEPVLKVSKTLEDDLVVGDRNNMAFLGTHVITGRGFGIVVATGIKTELGSIARLIATEEEKLTPVQEQLKRFSWFLLVLMLGVAVLIFLFGLLFSFPLLELVKTSIALAIAAIPEGLLVGVTVILAIGMQRMFKRKALVKKLVAAETLGSVSVICSDKTGTLTQGKLSLVRLITPRGEQALDKNLSDDMRDLLSMALLNNNASIGKDGVRIGEPTEAALLEGALACGLDSEAVRSSYERIKEIPFSSEHKYMVTVHNAVQEWLIMKGAPEVVFKHCALSAEQKKELEAQVESMAREGLRLLAFAYKDKESIDLKSDLTELKYAGLIALQDALRPSAAKTVQELRAAGVHVVLITGDHPATASFIARSSGISVREGGMLRGEQVEALSDDELYEQVQHVDVFARVSPEHKVRIVKAWQRRGHVVAMIGDGVNDAPALRASDMGVALGSGSDVAHEVADMVLLDDNLATIEAAIEQGRIIFDNIRKVIIYLMADSFSEMVLVAGSIMCGLPAPISAVQILWINLVSDGFPSLALTMEPGEKGIMDQPPRLKDEPIVNGEMKFIIFVIGIVTDIGLFGLYMFLRSMKLEMHHVQTIIFTALCVDSLLFVFSVRTLRTPLYRTNPFSNPWIVPAVAVGLCLQLAVLYVPALQRLFDTVPLNAYEWGLICAIAFVKIAAIEITKTFFIYKKK